ncbi:MAG TPA: transglycosylase SLT domain-containing protein [Rhodanobacteraceae bacterium]
MSARSTGTRLALTLMACAVLAACATTQPEKRLPTAAVITPIPEVPQPKIDHAKPKPAEQPWASIVASDVMPDCADSPLIQANAEMYTRWPAGFEQRLKQSLPLIIYVQKELRAAGIPGEFAMLPMLESSYDAAEPGHRGNAGGMWQLMPLTGRRHGVVINHSYNGLNDPVASTRAAIKMLKKLHAQFGDWRLVDMAYNAGPYAVQGAINRHSELGGKPIPAIPMSASTRTHLARLMALSCILRDPGRFNVELPQPAPNDELVAVELPAHTPLRRVAELAEINESRLRKLNPGYRGGSIPSDSPRTLLLPSDAAQSLAAALTVDASESIAQVNTAEQNSGPSNSIPLPAEPALPVDDTSSTAAPAHTTHHRVRKGETLWSIAQHYHVSVHDLKRWNDLHHSELRIGEELRIRG